jgi:hypothetical protein
MTVVFRQWRFVRQRQMNEARSAAYPMFGVTGANSRADHKTCRSEFASAAQPIDIV